MEILTHRCNRQLCCCPECGRPLIYSRKTDTHHCPDYCCPVNAGLTTTLPNGETMPI